MLNVLFLPSRQLPAFVLFSALHTKEIIKTDIVFIVISSKF